MSEFFQKLGETAFLAVIGAAALGTILKGIELFQKRHDKQTPVMRAK